MTHPMTQSPPTGELVARLREACNGHPHAKIAWPHRILHEAASCITTLERELEEAKLQAAIIEGISNELDVELTASQAEVERLKAALKPFAFEGLPLERALSVSPRVTPAAIERARAALQVGENKG